MKKYREFTETEEKWLKSFQRVMKKAPDTLFMFVGQGVTVYALDENQDRYMVHRSGSLAVDDYATNCIILTKIDFDGGDY